jgi:hypothetical protein
MPLAPFNRRLREGPQNRPKRTPPLAPPKRPPAVTAQQWAEQQAQRIVDEQLAAIREQQTSYNQTLQERAQQQAEAAQRFAAMVQALGIDKQIAGTYQSAGRDIAGMAQGFAGDVRDIAAADAAQQTRMLSGTGQEGAIRSEGVNMGDVLYGVGGYIPGKTMGEQGAAFAADAARAPAFMLEQRVGAAQQALQEGLQAGDKDFLDAILKVKTSKRDISDDLYKERVGQNLATQKMKRDQLESDRTYWLKLRAYYVSIGKMKLAQDAEKRAATAEQRYAYETQGRDSEGNVAPNYVQLPNGTIVPRSTLKKSGKGAKTLTPNAKAEILQGVLNQEDDITKVLPSVAKTAGLDAMLQRMGPPSPAQTKQLDATRKKIAKELWERYSPRAITPEAKKALRSMIARLVRSYTPTAPGSSLTEGLLP